MLNQTVNFSELLTSKSSEGYLIPTRGIGTPIAIEGILTLGRDPSNDIPIDDPFVSARHCQFEKRPGAFFVKDLKSRNGILVNGLKVTEGQLINQSQIQIGKTEFIFINEMPNSEANSLPLKSRNSEWMNRLRSLPGIAETELPVFLQGASGTGKEILAHIIHDFSKRNESPFVSVNCSALTETLVESELFGHVKGSFTGATNDRKGAFEAARGGTLFLDEIGDLPLSLQPKLLRALENHEIKPVGSDKAIETDVRIVTATHKNLQNLVADGQFRQDLYFRIHVLKITIPSLEDRMEDFEDLLYYFARELKVRFSVAAIEELKKHSWPGNIRELKNTVARASALYPQTHIQAEHVKHLITEVPKYRPNEIQLGGKIPLLKEVEKEMIKARLIANNGNQRKTAAELGMPKSTLHDRIKHYKIEVPSLMDVE